MPADRSTIGACLLALSGLAPCANASAAAAAPSPSVAASSVFGDWARSAAACARPELVLRDGSLTVQTDADGRKLVLQYPGAAYQLNAQGQYVVALGKTHPYGKTASKTSLTFNATAADQIELVTRRKPVPFVRCPAVAKP